MSLTVGQAVTGTGSGAQRRRRCRVDAARTRVRSQHSGQIVVIGTDSYIVNATVDDTEIGEIAVGDQVDITPTGSTTPVYGTVGILQPHRQPDLGRHDLPRRRRRHWQPVRPLCRRERRRQHHRQAAQRRHRGGDGAISYGTNGQATVTQVENGGATSSRT